MPKSAIHLCFVDDLPALRHRAPLPRGFAAMTPERRRELAASGGRAAHANGTAHEWTPSEASAAGKVGGRISRRRPAGWKVEGD